MATGKRPRAKKPPAKKPPAKKRRVLPKGARLITSCTAKLEPSFETFWANTWEYAHVEVQLLGSLRERLDTLHGSRLPRALRSER